MLNKKDPLIDAIQQVMQSNQADRDAVKAVNEKFGIQDRRVLPRERQGEWDAAYQTVLSEGVEALDEKVNMTKKQFANLDGKPGFTGADLAHARAGTHKKKAAAGELEEAEKKMKGDDPCWDNYEMIGMKKGKGGKSVPNCVPVKEQDYSATQPSKMGLKPDYAPAGATPDYAKSKEQTVNRAAKTSLPAGTMKEEEQIDEKAPPGAKYERMVKHIKSKMAKGGLTKKEKSIAYATAWKAKKKDVNEGFNGRHDSSVNASADKQVVVDQLNERLVDNRQRTSRLAPMHTQGIKQTQAITAREPADPQKSFSQKAAEVGRGVEAAARGVASGLTDVGQTSFGYKSGSDYVLDKITPGRGENLAKEFPTATTVGKGTGELAGLASGGVGLAKAGTKQAIKQTVKQTAQVAGKTDDVAKVATTTTKALSAPKNAVSQAAREPAAAAAAKTPTAVDNFISKAKSTPVSPAAKEGGNAASTAAANASKYNKPGTAGGRFSDNLAKARKGSENYGPSKGGVAVRKTTEPATVTRPGVPAVTKKPGVPAVANKPGVPAVANKPGVPAVANRPGLPATVGSGSTRIAGRTSNLKDIGTKAAVGAAVGGAMYGLSNKNSPDSAGATTATATSGGSAKPSVGKPVTAKPTSAKPVAASPAASAVKSRLQTRNQRDDTIGASGRSTKGPGGVTSGTRTGKTITNRPVVGKKAPVGTGRVK